jgi:hypothetical protein
LSLAANVPAASLLTIAAAMMSNMSGTLPLLKASAVVFSPANAKKMGISTTMATCSNRSMSVASSPSSRGKQIPNRNAPKTLCNPRASVM